MISKKHLEVNRLLNIFIINILTIFFAHILGLGHTEVK